MQLMGVLAASASVRPPARGNLLRSASRSRRHSWPAPTRWSN